MKNKIDIIISDIEVPEKVKELMELDLRYYSLEEYIKYTELLNLLWQNSVIIKK